MLRPSPGRLRKVLTAYTASLQHHASPNVAYEHTSRLDGEQCDAVTGLLGLRASLSTARMDVQEQVLDRPMHST